MKKIFSLALVVSLVAATSARAARDGDYLPYVGLDYSYSDTTAKHLRPHYNSASVNVGTMYNRFFGTEMFYQISDSYKTRSGLDKSKSSFQAYGLDVYGYLPLGCDQTFSLLGTAGIAEYTVTNKFTYGTSEKSRDHGYGYRLGLGAQYSIDNNWSVRAVARYIGLDKIDEADHMMEYSLGAKYNF